MSTLQRQLITAWWLGGHPPSASGGQCRLSVRQATEGVFDSKVLQELTELGARGDAQCILQGGAVQRWLGMKQRVDRVAPAFQPRLLKRRLKLEDQRGQVIPQFGVELQALHFR